MTNGPTRDNSDEALDAIVADLDGAVLDWQPTDENGVPLDALMVRDNTTNNPHLVKVVNGEHRALCNARYRVWEAGTIGEDLTTGEGIWEWASCARCIALADRAVRA